MGHGMPLYFSQILPHYLIQYAQRVTTALWEPPYLWHVLQGRTTTYTALIAFTLVYSALTDTIVLAWEMKCPLEYALKVIPFI